MNEYQELLLKALIKYLSYEERSEMIEEISQLAMENIKSKLTHKSDVVEIFELQDDYNKLNALACNFSK
jgi:hypothetical protein